MTYDDLSNSGFLKAARAAELRQRRLIAAAPDLAEAVRELLATHPAAYRDPGPIDNRTDNAIKIARAAIAKAEGTS